MFTSGKQGVNYSKRELIKSVFFHFLSMVPVADVGVDAGVL